MSTKRHEGAWALLSRARVDLETLELLAAQPKAAEEAVGFHCQQAIEKCFKAVLSAAGIRHRRTHDLQELLDLLADNGIPVPAALRDAWRFNPFAVEFRYGEFPPASAKLDRPALLAQVRACLAWAEGELAKAAKSFPQD